MSRKERIKNALGIPYYPWSSDEEDYDDKEPNITNLHLLGRQPTEPRLSVADMPGTSGQSATSLPATHEPSAESQLYTSPIRDAHERSLLWVLGHRRCDTTRNNSDVNRVLLNPSPIFRPSSSSSHHRPATPSTRSENVLNPVNNRLIIKRPYSYRTNRTTLFQDPRRRSSSKSVHSIIAEAIRCQHEDYSQTDNLRIALDALKASRRSQYNTDLQLQNYENGVSGEPAQLTPPDNMDVHSSNNVSQQSSSFNTPPSNNENHTQQTNTNSRQDMLEEEVVVIDEAETEEDVNRVAERGEGTRSSTKVKPEDGTRHGTERGDRGRAAARTRETAKESSAAASERAGSASKSSSSKRNKSERDETVPYTLKELNDSLLRLLECPVCMEWMEPPMMQCRRGHLVCCPCRSKLLSCPVCRTAFSSVRNRAMEGVAETVRYPCRHGCGNELWLRQRAAHEDNCAARRYECPSPLCADRAVLPHHQLEAHVQSKHAYMLKYGHQLKFSVKANGERKESYLVMALHQMFHLRVDMRSFGLFVIVFYIGPKCNAKNYLYEIIASNKMNARKFMYGRSTHSDLENSETIVSRQDCFYLTLDQATNFFAARNKRCEPEKIIQISVNINEMDINRDNCES